MKLLVAVLAILITSPFTVLVTVQADQNAGQKAPTTNSKIAVLDGDMASMQERLDMLRKYAQPGDEFHFTTAMFTEDSVGKTLMYELAEASKRGVKVRGIFDPALNRLPDQYVHYLVNAGVDLVEFHPMGDTLLQKAKTLVTPGKGITWLNNRSHDKVWALKKKMPDGSFDYMAIEGSRNFVDSHFGLDATVEKPLPNGKLPRKGAQLETLRPSGLQFDDIDVFIRGQAAREIIDYHNSVLESKHVGARNLVKRLGKFEDWKRATPAEQKEVLEYLEKELDPGEMGQVKKHLAALEEGALATKAEKAEALKYLRRNLTPDKTAREIAKTRDVVVNTLGILDRADDFDPFKDARDANLKFYHDTMDHNTPQGSEQAVLDGIRDAEGGDLVKVNVAGETSEIRYTATVYDQLEKLKMAQPGAIVEVAGQKLTVTPELKQAYASAFEGKKVGDMVHMISQYGIPTEEMLEAFTKATQRGVTVKFVVNGATSMWDGQAPIRGYEHMFEKLVGTGIEVRESASLHQIHTKAITVRNPVTGPRYAVIGSSNMDPRSLTVKKPGFGLDALSTRLRNSEVNWRITDAPDFIEWYEGKIGQIFYPGSQVAKGGTVLQPRKCPPIMRTLLRFPPAYRVL